MKGLTQFTKFDWDGFASGKKFLVISVGEYQDFNTQAHLGTKVECIITTDNTPYHFKDGVAFSNRFEKVVFKVEKDVNIPLDSYVMPKDVTASIYGEYRNQLSIKCGDILIATSAKGN